MEKKRIKAGLLTLFICFGIIAPAQKEPASKRYIDNDNWWYFQDIALERGLYLPATSNHNMSDGYITHFTCNEIHG
jgi:hypothetical protein